MGHAIEYALLKDQIEHDRMRAEGFATWFEQYAADFSSLIPRGQVHSSVLALARASIQQSGSNFTFNGTAEDYSRASLYMMTAVDRRGIAGLMSVYKTMTSQKLSIADAIKKEFAWTDSQLSKEMVRVAGG